MLTKDIAADAARIDKEGGPAAVARKLGVSVQRVHNWTKRGVPWPVRLAFPKMFPTKKPAKGE